MITSMQSRKAPSRSLPIPNKNAMTTTNMIKTKKITNKFIEAEFDSETKLMQKKETL
jgi:hypothetical protein